MCVGWAMQKFGGGLEELQFITDGKLQTSKLCLFAGEFARHKSKYTSGSGIYI